MNAEYLFVGGSRDGRMIEAGGAKPVKTWNTESDTSETYWPVSLGYGWQKKTIYVIEGTTGLEAMDRLIKAYAGGGA